MIEPGADPKAASLRIGGLGSDELRTIPTTAASQYTVNHDRSPLEWIRPWLSDATKL